MSPRARRLVCSEEPSSTAGSDGYTGRGETTSGSICIYGDPNEPSRPSCEGRNIGQAKGGVSGGLAWARYPLTHMLVPAI